MARGRPRRNGKRKPNGRLMVRECAESRQEIAARMPHRRGLGDNAADHRAENELGRLEIRGLITAEESLAGQYLRRAWGAYLATIGPPRPLSGRGRGYDCTGCPSEEERQRCTCAIVRVVWDNAHATLKGCGRSALECVQIVALHNNSCGSNGVIHLKRGLSALAQHFGLTKRSKSRHAENENPTHAS